MDELEFRKRAFANPYDNDPDFIQAAEKNPGCKRVYDELMQLENRLGGVLRDVDIPQNLASRLKQNSASGGHGALRSHYLLAASVVFALALTLSMLLPQRPNAADLELHDDLVQHLHHQQVHYRGDSEVSWAQVSAVVSAAGGRLHAHESLNEAQMKFANDCDISDRVSHSAHIVIQGAQGPVSIIYLHSSPVSTVVRIKDHQFDGRIIPLSEGNLVIAGDKGEALEDWEAIAHSAFEWNL
jgi:hypothetical protein